MQPGETWTKRFLDQVRTTEIMTTPLTENKRRSEYKLDKTENKTVIIRQNKTWIAQLLIT